MKDKTISVDFAQQLIDFAPTEQAKQMGFAEAQLHGAVAVYNMLARNRVSYIADEVGMGKTYVALGVMGLLRYQQPDARIVVLAPRENIQLKWIKELRNFVRDNWRFKDNRVKNLHNEPIRAPIACSSFDDLARLLRVDDASDLFLRATTFSVAVKTHEGRERCRSRLLPYLPWVDPSLLSTSEPNRFRDMYGRILNALMPQIDLLVVDEAHNFKHGFGDHVSNRNRLAGLGLGHPDGAHPDCAWYGPRVKRVLMLSATPFEYDYADLYRQLDVFGFGRIEFVDAAGAQPIPVDVLRGDDELLQRKLLRRFLIRRVQYLNIAGKRHSKNMYRREWRRGGYEQHDEPITLDDPYQRLVVGLVQKKVAEILGDRRFNNHFQIGMLSSFESFMETINRSKRLQAAIQAEGEDSEDGERVFDGDQDATRIEKQGIDSYALQDVVTSYREQFGHGLPHPKLDATASALADAFTTGEKALVFVRRVATVAELKVKLDNAYDRYLQGHMEAMLPELRSDIEYLFDRYRRETRGREPLDQSVNLTDAAETVHDELAFDNEENEGGTESFFAWFFRGEGPKGLLSGAAFQKNRLAAVSSVYATFFEDDHVAWLLHYPDDVVAALASMTLCGVEQTRARLRQLAAAYFQNFRARRDGAPLVFPRRYVLAYQTAGLRLLAEAAQGTISEQANTVLRERHHSAYETDVTPSAGFPEPGDGLGLKTFFTELVKRNELRKRIWPEDSATAPPSQFREQFRRREQRRELLSTMARLGAAYIDLYLLAIRGLGSFNLGAGAKRTRMEQALIPEYLDLLEAQMREPEPAFNAFRELSDAAEAFDTLMAVNFPDVRDAPMSQYSTLFGRVLQKQEPVGRMYGGVNKRLVKQFRMPGYPLVLTTTDVLQEGEDLHTFCQRVIHYGVTWTPSAMEQRTGRVDRIGSLVQRRLDGGKHIPEPRELIQVYYPHLSDTVERLQVRRVLERLHTFLCLVHRAAPGDVTRDSRLNVAREILREDDLVPQLEGLLESDFPVTSPWLQGDQTARDVEAPQLGELEVFFAFIREKLIGTLGVHIIEEKAPRRFMGAAAIREGRIVPWGERHTYPHYREQPFELSMRSQRVGEATLVRCVSPVGWLDLQDDGVVDGLYHLQRKLGMVRISARFDRRQHRYDTSIEGDQLFHLDTTQYEELEAMLVRTVMAADQIEAELLGWDTALDQWLSRNGEDAADA